MEFPIVNSKYEHVNTFINTLAPIVVNEYVRRKKNGEKLVFPATCIGQAALESGWNLEASTLFGIKGEGVIANTSEYVNGAYIDISASFQHYPSITEAVVGYYDLMQWDNYNDVTSAQTVEEELEGLTNNIGYAYATSPTYKTNVLSIINDYDLRAFNDYALSLFNDVSNEPTDATEETTEKVAEEVVPEPTPEPTPEPPRTLKYKEGDDVMYNFIFSTESSEEPLAPYFDYGTITKVNANARNPYMIGEGTGFINDDVITGYAMIGHTFEPTPEPNDKGIVDGSIVRFIGTTDYNGVSVKPWRDSYVVKQIVGDRVVLVNSDDELFCACRIEDVELV